MDRNMSRTLRTFALVLAVAVALAAVPTASVQSQDLGTSLSGPATGDPDGLTSSASGRTLIDPNGLTSSGNQRVTIDPDGRV